MRTRSRSLATTPPAWWSETGREAQLFKPGDEVFYAGSVGRQGANMEFHLVDERIVGRKPRTLDFAAAAALPLTSITAWEAMFDRLDVAKPVPGAARAILILGGAGGVGSIAIQLARQLTDLTIVATASRPETVQWAKDMGAHHVVDHRKPLAPQIAALGHGRPRFHLRDVAHWRPHRRPRRIDRAAGTHRSHQRRSGRSFRLQAEERVHSL